MHLKNIMIKNPFHYTQKDNKNIDGTDNMTKSKIWGRFNHCFVASDTSFINQHLTWLDSLGYKRSTNGLMDEDAMLKVLAGVIINDDWEAIDSLYDEIQKERFLWDKHIIALNRIISAYNKPEFKYRYYIFTGDFKKIISSLEDGFQVLFGVNQKAVNGSGGHIVNISGGRFIDNQPEFLRIEDPAGDITSPRGGYKDNSISGANVIYKAETLKKIMVPNKSHYAILEYPNGIKKD